LGIAPRTLLYHKQNLSTTRILVPFCV